jgi:beta-lactamase regulating signal transducer with metallopeptidase domain
MFANFAWHSVDSWQTVGWTMVHFLWLGTAVGAAAALLCWMLRRAEPNTRYVCALASLAILSALPVAVAVWLVCTGPATQISAIGDGGASEGSGFRVQGSGLAFGGDVLSAVSPGEVIELSNPAPLGATGSASAELPSNVGHSIEAHTGKASGTQALALLHACVPYMPWLWIVGTPLTFAMLATGVVGTRRLQGASQSIHSGPIFDACARLARSLAIGRDVSLAVCERIAAPALIGILRPMILLPPAAITGWSPDEIEMVLLHELAHVRRWDNLVNLLQRLVESLYFFHPAVWLVSSWVRREREACCDAIVVAQTHRPRAYAEMLIALAARMPRSALFSPAAASAMAAGPLRSRIKQILKLEDDPMLVSGKSLALATVVMLALVPLTVMQLPLGSRAAESAAENEAQTVAAKQTANDAKTEATIELALKQTDADENARWKKLFAVSDENPILTMTYEIPTSIRAKYSLPNLFESWQFDPYGPLVKFEAKWSADQATVEIRAPQAAHEQVFSRLAEEFELLDALANGSEAARSIKAQIDALRGSLPDDNRSEVVRLLREFVALDKQKLELERRIQRTQEEYQAMLDQLKDPEFFQARVDHALAQDPTVIYLQQQLTADQMRLQQMQSTSKEKTRAIEMLEQKIAQTNQQIQAYRQQVEAQAQQQQQATPDDQRRLLTKMFQISQEFRQRELSSTNEELEQLVAQLESYIPAQPEPAQNAARETAAADLAAVAQVERSQPLQRDEQSATSGEATTAVDAKADAAADPNELVFELYTIPDDLRNDVRNWLNESRGNFITAAKWGNSGNLMLQAPRHYHQRLKSLLDSTRNWRRSVERQRALAPLVKENLMVGPRARLVATGLVFGPQAQTASGFPPGGFRGVEVVEVAPGSPAAWQNIEPGQVMIYLEGFHTPSLEVLEATVDNLLKGFPNTEAATLHFGRPGERQSRQVELPIRLQPPRIAAVVPSPPTDSESGDASQQQPSGRRGSTGGGFGSQFGRRGSGRRGEAGRRGTRSAAQPADELRAQSLDLATPRGDAQFTVEGDQIVISSPTQQALDQVEADLRPPRENAPGIAEWEKIVARTPRVDAIAAKMAWEKLGLKLIPASSEELNRLGVEPGNPYSQRLKIVGGNLPPGLPVPSYVESLDRQPVLYFDMLWEFLSNRPPSALLVVAQDIEKNRYVFDSQPGAPLPPDAVEVNEKEIRDRIEQLLRSAESAQGASGSASAPFEAPTLFRRTATGPQATQPAERGPSRSALRFEGKRFDEWRDAWRTELSAEKRLEAVKALAAFGANGYGKEAAAAILEVVKLYDWSSIPGPFGRAGASTSPINDLKREALNAFVGGPRDVSPSIVGEDWLPVLIEAARTGHPQVINFANQVLRRYSIRPQIDTKELRALIPQIIEWTRDESLGPVRAQVASVLVRLNTIEKDDHIVGRLVEMLRDKDETARRIALDGLYGAFEAAASEAVQAERTQSLGGQRRTQGGREVGDLVVPPAEFRPELIELLKQPPPDMRMRIVGVLGLLRAKAAPAVPHLLPLLLDRDDPYVPLGAAESLERITGSDQAAQDYLNQIISTGQPADQVERARATLAELAERREREAQQSQAELGGQGGGRSVGRRGRLGGRGGAANDATDTTPGSESEPGSGGGGGRGQGRGGAD